MDSFGARFSEEKYIKVDIDFESGENEVTGAITWDEGELG